jgi:uncharacterized membrane protein YphA (DoxX/SURF4 family)
MHSIIPARGSQNHARPSAELNEGGPAWRKKPALFVARLALGLVFIVASGDKILHPKAFAEIIHNYQILPNDLINIVAIVLPWLELVLGVLLVVGLWLPGAVILADVLLLVFLFSLIFNAIRGLDVHCGCFATSGDTKSTVAWTILRDSGFLLVGGYLLFQILPREQRKRSRPHP